MPAKLILAIAVPSDATPEYLAAALREEAPKAADRIERVEHSASLCLPGVGGGDTWAAQLVHVPLID